MVSFKVYVWEIRNTTCTATGYGVIHVAYLNISSGILVLILDILFAAMRHSQ